MKKSLLFMLSLLTFCAAASADADAKKIRRTYTVPGKTVFNYRGCGISVRCFDNGTPQLYFSKPVDRFGGIVVSVEKRNLKGKRINQGNKNIYDFGEDGRLQLELNKDGLITCEFQRTHAKPTELSIPFTGRFFENSKVQIDGKIIPLGAYVENPKYNYSLIHKGDAKVITLLKDQPEKEFSFLLPEPCKIKFGNFTKAKRMELIIDIPADAKNFRFSIDPGYRLHK